MEQAALPSAVHKSDVHFEAKLSTQVIRSNEYLHGVKTTDNYVAFDLDPLA